METRKGREDKEDEGGSAEDKVLQCRPQSRGRSWLKLYATKLQALFGMESQDRAQYIIHKRNQALECGPAQE